MLGAINAGAIAELVSGELVGSADITATRFDTLDTAREGSLSFLRDQSFAKGFATTKASVVLVSRSIDLPEAPATCAVILVDSAEAALMMLLERASPPPDVPPIGIHPTADVHPTAEVDPAARIGPGCRIGAGAVIGAEAALVSNVSVGPKARVGASTVLRPNVTIEQGCIIGARGLVHPGVVLGADGFGFRQTEAGHIKIPHIGNVEVGDDCEIGANTTIDRGKLGPTRIGHGTKIDNLCQIGHNCVVGNHVIICGTTGIAGSVTIGDGTIIGGGCGIVDNITIGAGATLAGSTRVHCDIPAGETWAGIPGMPARTALANHAAFRKLAELSRTVKKLAAAANK